MVQMDSQHDDTLSTIDEIDNQHDLKESELNSGDSQCNENSETVHLKTFLN